ncbi:hypothetical protein GXW78_15730 [Roseomonas terrae]|uniref:Uncharacterized protein n=1 Tax=Neoroseomonas terrae TaxID=424799 RepID=A0ABS5EJB9_9PROT|nr:hypothetical protein [Neoroseomonas terrae]MBR0651122.1 hypothetical protein [Neoroseomonas terrae]
MLSLNTLSAFTQEVTRSAGIQPVRGPERADAARGAGVPPQRILESAPPTGSAPPAGGASLPRGSLLDLRV